MTNIVIAYNDAPAIRGIYSGSLWVDSLPLENLSTYDPKQVARSNALATVNFLLDFGYSASIDLVALLYHNITAAGTARVRVGPNANGSGALIDQTLDPGDFGTDYPASLFYLSPETVSAQYVLWNITDAANPDGYVQIGRHLACDVFQPEINMPYGAQLTMVDETRLTRTVNGSQYADLKPKRRILSGAIDLLTEAEAFDEIYNLQRVKGITKPIFMIYDPSMTGDALQRTSVYGDLTELQPIELAQVGADGSSLSTWRFDLEERT